MEHETLFARLTGHVPHAASRYRLRLLIEGRGVPFELRERGLVDAHHVARLVLLDADVVAKRLRNPDVAERVLRPEVRRRHSSMSHIPMPSRIPKPVAVMGAPPFLWRARASARRPALMLP